MGKEMSNYQLNDALIEYGYYPGLIGNERTGVGDPGVSCVQRRRSRLRCHVSEQSKTPGKKELKTLYGHQIQADYKESSNLPLR
ncbi:hypothetical protein R6Z07F_012965 [Ovis aries]